MSINELLPFVLPAVFASIPVIIWVVLFFKQNKENKQSKPLLVMIFLLGILVAPTLLGIQYLWEIYPTFNLETILTSSVESANFKFMIVFVLFGMMEEVFKHFAMRIIDKKTIIIKTVNDALRCSILAALGFSFAENIYYMYMYWSTSFGQLAGMYIFRSTITMCMHLVVSGIFGYYFGISKFSIDITSQKKMIGEESFWTRATAKLLNLPLAKAYREKMILKGLLFAMVFHAIFNFLLQYNVTVPAILLVIIGFLFLLHLLKRKAGHLVLFTDISAKRKSNLAKKDEEVVMELLAMWFKEKKFVDVIHICERLLERDPDNNVVKLFKAEALDKIDDTSVYKKIINSLFRSKNDLPPRL